MLFWLTDQFWKAPELLRIQSPCMRGTQKADVYAFGIILYEIIGRRGPFGFLGYEPKGRDILIHYFVKNTYTSHLSKILCLRVFSIDIIELVKRKPLPGEEPFRPDLDYLMVDAENRCAEYILQCMKDCWAESPELRPDFHTIRVRLKKMKDGKYVTMINTYLFVKGITIVFITTNYHFRTRNIMDQMMEMMVKYADNLEDLVTERTRLLYEEKMKTEDLLHRMLPK